MSGLPAPVILLAAPFSGAFVAAAMLGRHPQVCALPQLNLFMARDVHELLEIFRLSQGPAADGLLRAVASLIFERDDDAGIAQAQDWLQDRAAQPVGHVLRELAARAAPRVLLLPDVETPLRPADIDRLREQVPEARYVHLVRHPWSQGVLLHDRCADRLFAPVDFKDFSYTPPPVEPQIPWLRANRNVQDWFASHAPVHRLRWEDLIAQPEATLAPLCAALGLASDAAALSAVADYEHWDFWGHGPAAAPYGLDAEVLEEIPDPVFEAAFAAPSLEAPLPWREDGAGFTPAVRSLAREYGYE